MQTKKPTSRFTRTTDLGNIDFANVIRAIKAVLIDHNSIRGAGRLFKVPPSSLHRYINAVKVKYENIAEVADDDLEAALKRYGTYAACTVNQVFSSEEEEQLVGYIKRCSDHYHGLSANELRQLAYQFGVKIRAKYPTNWNEKQAAGRDWYYGFMRRHQSLALSTPPELTSLNRVKSLPRENVSKFFENLSAMLAKNNFDALNIWNMDEVGFSTVPTQIGKVISKRGQPQDGQIVAAEQGTIITVALAVNAAGVSIPPFFLFPRQNMQSKFMDNASLGAVGYANGSGWMQQPEFLAFIKFFIRCTDASKETQKLLLLDNHASHLSNEALDVAAENGVTLLPFPPHCSHRLQPLDASVYGPVKAHFKSQCIAWQMNNAGKVLEIRNITGLICTTLDYALTPHNIKAGFKATGIAPYNPDIFADSDFIQAVVNGKNQRSMEEAINFELDKDNQRRIVVLEVPVAGACEKLTTSVEPSTSISQTSSFSSILSTIQALQPATSEERAKLREKQEKRNYKTSNKRKTKPPIKTPTEKSSSEDDGDFCTICFEPIPRHLDRNNSIACCIECKREVHLKCAHMTASFYICQNCDSE